MSDRELGTNPVTNSNQWPLPSKSYGWRSSDEEVRSTQQTRKRASGFICPTCKNKLALIGSLNVTLLDGSTELEEDMITMTSHQSDPDVFGHHSSGTMRVNFITGEKQSSENYYSDDEMPRESEENCGPSREKSILAIL